MKSFAIRMSAVLVALVAVVLLAGAASKAKKGGALAQPDKLVILSTTDVKGKTSPCG